MRLTVTLDYYNGERGKAKEIEADELDTRALIFAMMQADVCGVTLTKTKSIHTALKRMAEQD